jgi:hypothetical protein
MKSCAGFSRPWRLSANALVSDARQLAGQLIGRLLGNSAPSIQALVNQAAESKAWPWFRPLVPSLTVPGGPLICTLEGHTGTVSAVAVTPDGRRAVCDAQRRTNDREPPRATHYAGLKRPRGLYQLCTCRQRESKSERTCKVLDKIPSCRPTSGTPARGPITLGPVG